MNGFDAIRELSSAPNPQLQLKAMQLFEELKQSQDGWKGCIQALCNNMYVADEQSKFYCLQVIELYVKNRYGGDMSENEDLLRKFLLYWPEINQLPPCYFLQTKIAQITGDAFVKDYPERWPHFFADFIITFKHGEVAVENYLRILKAIHHKIADNEVSRNNADLLRSNAIKDKIRCSEVNGLVDSWLLIMNKYEIEKPSIVCLCHKVIGSYVQWIDINLIANSEYVSCIVRALKSLPLRDTAADCICGILSKGMDPISKTKLIDSINTFLVASGIWAESQKVDEAPEFISKLGNIVNAMGSNLCESHSKLIKRDPLAAQSIIPSIEAKAELLFFFLGYGNEDVASSVFDFTKDYLHYLKQKGALSQREKEAVLYILKIVCAQLKYKDNYNFNREREAEANFQEFRKLFRILFDNVLLVEKDLVINELRNRISNSFEHWRTIPFEDVEVALYLLFSLGESYTTIGSQFSTDLVNSTPLQILLFDLIKYEVHLHTHSAVLIQYFEAVVRYEKFFTCHPGNILVVLMTFLKERGLFHPDSKVRSRSVYLFSRFFKAIRQFSNGNLTEDILQAIEQLLPIVDPLKVREQDRVLSNDDQLYLYEAVGVIISSGLGESQSEKIPKYMNQIIAPLLETCRNCASELKVFTTTEKAASLVTMINQAIGLIGRLTKCFNSQLTMKICGCVPIFLEALHIFLGCVEVTGNGDNLVALQSSVRQYLHRMVVCLDNEILSYIPVASGALLRNIDNRSVQDYIPLINQTIVKFKKEVSPFLKQIFPPMVQSISNILSERIDENDEVAFRDRLSLQRQYFQFISVVVSNDLLNVLSDDPPLLQTVLFSLIEGAISLSDPIAQKTCFSVIRKLVEIWGGENAPPGFIEYMYKNILPACFVAPTKVNFDWTDAQSLLVLNETAHVMKCIYDKRKDEAIKYLQNIYFPTLNVPINLSTAYINNLPGPIKPFTAFLKTFFSSMVKTN